MSTATPLQTAEKHLGVRRIAQVCDVTYEAARKWFRQGHLPRTEWTGETAYAVAIAAACPEVTVSGLLAAKPKATDVRHARSLSGGSISSNHASEVAP